MRLRWLTVVVALTLVVTNPKASLAYTVTHELVTTTFLDAPEVIKKYVKDEYPWVKGTTLLAFHPLFGMAPSRSEISKPLLIQVHDRDTCDTAGRCKTIVVNSVGAVVLRTFAKSRVDLNGYGLPGGKRGSTFVLNQGCGLKDIHIQVDVENNIEISSVSVCPVDQAYHYFAATPDSPLIETVRRSIREKMLKND
jgi:hypothetical protein